MCDELIARTQSPNTGLSYFFISAQKVNGKVNIEEAAVVWGGVNEAFLQTKSATHRADPNQVVRSWGDRWKSTSGHKQQIDLL